MNAASQYQLEQAAGLLAQALNRRSEFSLAEHERLKDLHTSLVLLCQKNLSDEPFHEWLNQQEERQDRTGQLSRLAALDRRWPRLGASGLTPYVERLRLTNLTKDGPHLRGMCGSDLVERYLYPAWDEYTEGAQGRQLRLVSAGRS